MSESTEICDECDAPEICEGQTGNCTREVTKDWASDPNCSTFLDRSEEQRWKDVQRFMDNALGALSMLRDTSEGDTGYFTKEAITHRLDEMRNILDSRPF